jgi:hypothetical protein
MALSFDDAWMDEIPGQECARFGEYKDDPVSPQALHAISGLNVCFLTVHVNPSVLLAGATGRDCATFRRG